MSQGERRRLWERRFTRHRITRRWSGVRGECHEQSVGGARHHLRLLPPVHAELVLHHPGLRQHRRGHAPVVPAGRRHRRHLHRRLRRGPYPGGLDRRALRDAVGDAARHCARVGRGRRVRLGPVVRDAPGRAIPVRRGRIHLHRQRRRADHGLVPRPGARHSQRPDHRRGVHGRGGDRPVRVGIPRGRPRLARGPAGRRGHRRGHARADGRPVPDAGRPWGGGAQGRTPRRGFAAPRLRLADAVDHGAGVPRGLRQLFRGSPAVAALRAGDPQPRRRHRGEASASSC